MKEQDDNGRDRGGGSGPVNDDHFSAAADAFHR